MSENQANKKSKKGIIITIIVIVVLLFIAIAAFIFYHSSQAGVLIAEIQNVVSNMENSSQEGDLQEAIIDMEIKTKGKYAIVEETLKNYLNDVLTLSKEAVNIFNEEAIMNMVSIKNIKEDGPDFVKTKEQIATMKAKLEEYVKQMEEKASQEALLGAIEDKPVGEYYKELYRQLAVDEASGQELATALEDLKEAEEALKQSLDYFSNIIEFLSNNKDSWTVEGDQIIFNSQTKLDEYNALVSNVPTFE